MFILLNHKKCLMSYFFFSKLIQHFCQLIDQHGTDFWWSLSLEELAPNSLISDLDMSTEDIEKRIDILDIWFDSGLSWYNVLGPQKQADVYLEGVDQCTGWFQSSLILSTALEHKSPFKNLYVHGFVVDENGQKMSKSLGNVVDPEEVIKGKKGQNPYGIDTLRWWIAAHGNQDSLIHIGENVLKNSYDDVQKVRSTLRFALGALNDYKPKKVEYGNLLLIDKYLLHLLKEYHELSDAHKTNFQFNKICTGLINLLTNPVSALYYTAVKDRLYCNFSDDPSRRSAQYVMMQIIFAVCKSIAPILPHLVEEIYMNLPQKNQGSFFQNAQHFSIGEHWSNDVVKSVMDAVLNIRKEINKELSTNTIPCATIQLIAGNELYLMLKVNV